MKISNIILSVIVALLACSCSSVRHTADSVPVKTSVVSFTVADMDVQPAKTMKTFSWGWNPLVRRSISTIKENTEARLLEDAGCDVLVEPQYIVEKRGIFRGGSVTVIGFPAKYNNFHKMTKEEAEIVKNIDFSSKKEKKRFFFF